MADTERTITIERSQVFILPETLRGEEFPMVKVRAFAEGKTFKPGMRSSRLQGDLIYDGGILIGRVPKDEPAVTGPVVDRFRSYDYQRPVFDGPENNSHRWVPVEKGAID